MRLNVHSHSVYVRLWKPCSCWSCCNLSFNFEINQPNVWSVFWTCSKQSKQFWERAKSCYECDIKLVRKQILTYARCWSHLVSDRSCSLFLFVYLFSLCLLQEIQQQRAAQKLMHIFNQLKPSSMRHSPRWFYTTARMLFHSNVNSIYYSGDLLNKIVISFDNSPFAPEHKSQRGACQFQIK